VEGDFWGAGGYITINGDLQDDVRIAGGVLTLGPNAQIADDVFAAGYSFDAAAGSTVGGSLFWGGYQAKLAGEVIEDFSGGMGALEIAGRIGGNVEVDVGEPVSEFEAIDSYFWMDEEGDKQWFFALPQDTYDVKIRGTGSGNFHLLTSPSGEGIHDHGDTPIAAGEQATLTMNPEEDELTLADGSKPMFEVIPLESERLALPFPAHLLLFATGGVAGLAFFALLIFLLVTRRRPVPAAPPVTQPARPVRPRGHPEELVSRRPPARPKGPPERLGGGKPSGPPETLD